MTDADFWNRIAPKYAKDPITDMDAYNETLNRITTYLHPDNKVLEIGCGTGSTALLLADKVASYHGTDISTAMIDIARAKISDDQTGLSFDAAPADAIPQGQFDVILALNLLHLVPDLAAVLKAAHDALPAGGTFIAKTALLRDGAWFLPKIIPVMKFFGKAPDCLILSDAQLKTALDDAGFDLIETLTQNGIAPRVFTVARKR